MSIFDIQQKKAIASLKQELESVLASLPSDLEELQEIATHITSLISVKSEHELNQVKALLTGQESALGILNKSMRTRSAEEKKSLGRAIHSVRTPLNALLETTSQALQSQLLLQKIDAKLHDPTLPSGRRFEGGYHPITLFRRMLENLLTKEGFTLCYGQEIETPRYNFDALNFEQDHPARTAHDTFYIDAHHLLRTHTSNMQIHFMKQNPEKPFQMASMGRVYRKDSDPTHAPMFHQIEGLVVGKKVHFGHLRYTLDRLLQSVFKKSITTRYRPSYFPFTEPSVEVDMSCIFCKQGTHCSVCSGSKWIEVLGAGMVHPNVLEGVGINSEIYQGFAFGIGVERLLMLYYGINDIRLLFENDLEFLRQFHTSNSAV